MDEVLEQIWEEMIAELRKQAEEFGEELGDAVDDVAAYAAERSRHLAGILMNGEPGFQAAVLVERDNIALKAGLAAVQRGDELDERIKGSLLGALQFAAKALSVIL